MAAATACRSLPPAAARLPPSQLLFICSASAACCRQGGAAAQPASLHLHCAPQDQGNAAFKAGNFEEAAERFSAAIDLDPTNHVLYSNRSAAYASLKRYDAALKDAKKTVELKPDWARVGTGLASFGCRCQEVAVGAALAHATCKRRCDGTSGRWRRTAMINCCTSGLQGTLGSSILLPPAMQGYSRLGAAHHGLRQWDDAVQAYSKGGWTACSVCGCAMLSNFCWWQSFAQH